MEDPNLIVIMCDLATANALSKQISKNWTIYKW
jgi:hypothetical protein